jgi:nitrite reductase/ring-hydroxylating ferredoxin subunit
VGCTYILGLEGRRKPSVGDCVSTNYRFPGIPVGWYTVAESKDVKRGQVETVKYFGEELVLYRTESGEAHLTGAYCPHLGAHLGAGKVDGENFQCPFHGFQFGPEGRCVRAYGKSVPRKAALSKWPIREHNGYIFAWYHPNGAAPDWELPVFPGPEEGWSTFSTRELRVRSHPQETSENSVDVGHFVQLHGFGDAWYEGDLDIQGHVLRGAYGIRYPLIPGRAHFTAKFDVTVHGLGFSHVQVNVERPGILINLFVLSSPIDEETVLLRTSAAVRNWGGPVTKVIRELAAWGLHREVGQDAPVWESKRYLERPLLAEGDGPIGEYRRYCKQFYVDAQSTTGQRDKLPVVAA